MLPRVFCFLLICISLSSCLQNDRFTEDDADTANQTDSNGAVSNNKGIGVDLQDLPVLSFGYADRLTDLIVQQQAADLQIPEEQADVQAAMAASRHLVDESLNKLQQLKLLAYGKLGSSHSQLLAETSSAYLRWINAVEGDADLISEIYQYWEDFNAKLDQLNQIKAELPAAAKVVAADPDATLQSQPRELTQSNLASRTAIRDGILQAIVTSFLLPGQARQDRERTDARLAAAQQNFAVSAPSDLPSSIEYQTNYQDDGQSASLSNSYIDQTDEFYKLKRTEELSTINFSEQQLSESIDRSRIALEIPVLSDEERGRLDAAFALAKPDNSIAFREVEPTSASEVDEVTAAAATIDENTLDISYLPIITPDPIRDQTKISEAFLELPQDFASKTNTKTALADGVDDTVPGAALGADPDPELAELLAAEQAPLADQSLSNEPGLLDFNTLPPLPGVDSPAATEGPQKLASLTTPQTPAPQPGTKIHIWQESKQPVQPDLSASNLVDEQLTQTGIPGSTNRGKVSEGAVDPLQLPDQFLNDPGAGANTTPAIDLPAQSVEPEISIARLQPDNSLAGGANKQLPTAVFRNQGDQLAAIGQTIRLQHSTSSSRTWARLFFKSNSIELSLAAKQKINDLAMIFKQLQREKIANRLIVAGFTDRKGAAGYNQILSQRRAESVKKAFTDIGISQQQITIFAFGETLLLNQTADGIRNQQNRRSDVIIGSNK